MSRIMFRKKNHRKIVFHGHPCIHPSSQNSRVKIIPFFHHNRSHPGAKIPNFTGSPGVGAVGNRCSSSSSSFNGIQEEKYFPLKDKKSKIELKEGKNKRK